MSIETKRIGGNTQALPENMLVNIKEAQNEAFIGLFISCYDNVFRYLLRQTGNLHDAQDLTQDAFLSGFSSFIGGRYEAREETPHGGYVMGVAKNELKLWRRAKTKNRIVSPFEENSSGENRTDEQAIDKTRTATLLIAVKFLPESQQEVIFYKMFTGFSDSEIAEIINKSNGATKQLIFRARESVKHFLGNHPYG